MWTLHIPQRVEKELREIPRNVEGQIHKALEQLQQDPYPAGCKKLKGRLECWRIRVGSYRILYDVLTSRHVIVILKIGLRKDVYRLH